MPRKTTSPEQMINKLRGAEIILSQGNTITVIANNIGVIVQTHTAGEKSLTAGGWISLMPQRSRAGKLPFNEGSGLRSG